MKDYRKIITGRIYFLKQLRKEAIDIKAKKDSSSLGGQILTLHDILSRADEPCLSSFELEELVMNKPLGF